MATNVVEFNRQVRATLNKPKEAQVRLLRKGLLQFVRTTATIMPFRTGHARANIVVSVNGPNTQESFDEPLTVEEVVSRARAVLQSARYNSTVFVNFNAPYTSFLNDGSSSQAPAGFIDLAVAEFNRLMEVA